MAKRRVAVKGGSAARVSARRDPLVGALDVLDDYIKGDVRVSRPQARRALAAIRASLLRAKQATTKIIAVIERVKARGRLKR